MTKKKVCVVTGTRAEYGLLYWLLKKIKKDAEFDLQIIATGMHLSPEFGLTYKQIEEDNFIINEKVEMLLSSDTSSSVTKSVGLGVISFADAFKRLEPDLLIILGDRFEIFAAAQAAMIMRIPIAHIHGGELTEGLIDDPIRHSITKMSHIHFTANNEYKNRVIQMGEQPNRVFNVGTLGIEGIKNSILLSKEELSKSLEFNLNKYFLITLHPTTLESGTAKKQAETLLDTLDKYPDYQLIFTKTNADTDGRIINNLFEKYVNMNPSRCKIYDSLGQIRYLSAIKYCEMVIGNSSSGLLEVPYFRKPTIDLGIRQSGRLKAKSVIECDFNSEKINAAIKKGFSSEFQQKIKTSPLLYGEGETSTDILKILKKIDFSNLLVKKFYDLKRG